MGFSSHSPQYHYKHRKPFGLSKHAQAWSYVKSSIELQQTISASNTYRSRTIVHCNCQRLWALYCSKMCFHTHIRYSCRCRGRRIGLVNCEYRRDANQLLAGGAHWSDHLVLMNESLCENFGTLMDYVEIGRKCGACTRAEQAARRRR
jgi:hypothetical protein